MSDGNMSPHQCSYCRLPISSCRFKCTECSDFIVCLQCFACGAEAGGHRRDHKYQVLNPLNENGLSILGGKEGWKVVEEEALLEGIELYSFGNWGDIAETVKTKTAEECSEHYWTYFINGNIGRTTFVRDLSTSRKITDHTSTEKGLLTPSASTSPLPPIDLTIQEQQELGYMPLRDEFDREYDDGAEGLISSLSWNYDDEDIDSAFKLLQVDIYRRRMKERERRKRLAKDYGIIVSATAAGTKRLQAQRAKQSKDDRDIRERMRIFSRFHHFSQHEQLHLSLQREKRMKNRVKELVKYRRNGVTKITDCAVFEEERMLREKKKKMGTLAVSGKAVPAILRKDGKPGSGVGSTVDDSIVALGNRLTNSVKPRQTPSDHELLSHQEKRLCHSIGLKPATYITIKTCVIRDYLQRQHGAPTKIRYPAQLDKVRRRRMLSFFVENGWITVAS